MQSLSDSVHYQEQTTSLTQFYTWNNYCCAYEVHNPINAYLPQGRGIKIPGRNVLPYESTAEFVKVIAPFITEFS